MEETKVKGSVIVVDDEASVRDVVSRALREDGYEVITAANGKEALELTARRTFDLMFLDINMPGMNGMDVLTLMSACSPATPVVMLTGVVDMDNQNEANHREAFAYLTKPCNLTKVTSIANKLIAKTASPEETDPSNDVLLHSVSDALQGDTTDSSNESAPSKTILVVDDEAPVREIIARVLRETGYDVDTAADGYEALIKARKQHFGLMFLDIRMPGMSGLEVLEQMAEKHPSTTVVMLTAVENQAALMDSTQHEAFSYLMKPCDLNEILDIANQLLRD